MTTPDSQPFVTFEWFDVDQETGQPTGDPVFRQEFTGHQWDVYYALWHQLMEAGQGRGPPPEGVIVEKVKLEVDMVIPPGSIIIG